MIAPPAMVDGMSALLVTVAFQSTMVEGSGALDKLVDTAPLTAVLLGGLWFVFSAYRSQSERMITVVSNNTEAMTKVSDRLSSLEDRMTRIEDRKQ